jgi:hypothetical protein
MRYRSQAAIKLTELFTADSIQVNSTLEISLTLRLARDFDLRANNQDVLVQTRNAAGAVTSQRALTITNQSGAEDSFTSWQGGFVVGGPIRSNRLFYFASFEGDVTNATEEHSFAVPTIQERGAFGTGITGIFQNPFDGQPTATVPTTRTGSGIFESLSVSQQSKWCLQRQHVDANLASKWPRRSLLRQG